MALVLVGDPATAGMAAVSRLRAWRRAGCDVDEIPADGAALLRRLREGEPEALKLIDYTAFLGGLPHNAQAAIRAQWGAPERDATFRPGELDCGAFVLPMLRLGDVAVALEPARGEAGEPPPHAFFAVHAWLRHAFGAERVVPADGDAASARDPWRRLALGPLADAFDAAHADMQAGRSGP